MRASYSCQEEINMMSLQYYVELKDTSNPDEWSNKLDLYGYDNEVLIMGMGYCNTIPTTDIETTIDSIDEVVSKLTEGDFILLNKEDKSMRKFTTIS